MADFISKQCAWLSTTASCVPLLSELDSADKEFMTLPFDVEDISNIRKRASDSTMRILPRECLLSDGGDSNSLPEYRCSLLTKCSSCTMISPTCVWCDEGCRDLRSHVTCLNRRKQDSCPPEEPVRWHRYESVGAARLSLPLQTVTRIALITLAIPYMLAFGVSVVGCVIRAIMAKSQ
ncbi:MAG: uncharacterized protein KVP18_002748 [Porospora cf. gigantea A]|uniref:uncharacterized protein n=1 Tax=Porospora cf. gigantea A TaxID=2853593 RepID=UPI00355A2312|nr:MAG: hypothetical protein KVP18_002748 [Porospora cf. gigantea A]